MPEPRRFALLGDPVEHSLSPVMLGAAFAFSAIDAEYLALRADLDVLRDGIESLREGDWHGMNVTMPLKFDAAALSDELTVEASRAGSANTLRQSKGRVEGHSTDVVAFSDIAGRRFDDLDEVLLLGSGGAAAAALAAFEDRRVYVSSRDRRKAESLANRSGAAGVVDWGSAIEGGLLVNATPLGMHLELLPAGLVDSAEALIDLTYGANTTPAAARAAARGVPVVDGVEFLAVAAAASFEWWTGVPVDSDVLLEAARNA